MVSPTYPEYDPIAPPESGRTEESQDPQEGAGDVSTPEGAGNASDPVEGEPVAAGVTAEASTQGATQVSPGSRTCTLCGKTIPPGSRLQRNGTTHYTCPTE